jgi:hypothetical protein
MLFRIIYLSAFVSLAAAHGKFRKVVGDNGVIGLAMDNDPAVPTTGTGAAAQVCSCLKLIHLLVLITYTQQGDTAVIRDGEIQSGKVGPCGRTKKGPTDIAAQMQGKFFFFRLAQLSASSLTNFLLVAAAAGLPSSSPSGELRIVLHQINQDGAGCVCFTL